MNIPTNHSNFAIDSIITKWKYVYDKDDARQACSMKPVKTTDEITVTLESSKLICLS